MKPNAPEKIYLEKVYPDNGVLPNGLNYNQSPNDIEYIKKDSFIEKTSLWIEKNIKKWYKNITVHGFRGMTPLMIAEFKKYVEGE